MIVGGSRACNTSGCPVSQTSIYIQLSEWGRPDQHPATDVNPAGLMLEIFFPASEPVLHYFLKLALRRKSSFSEAAPVDRPEAWLSVAKVNERRVLESATSARNDLI